MARFQNQDDPPPTFLSRARHSSRRSLRTVAHHVKRHVGVGIICSVAYFDPLGLALATYRPMLFVILMAGLGAIVLQTLACKLGCVTGLGNDHSSHKLLLHNHPRHPRLVRRLVLYPLYVLSEIAIISTDLAELLGSSVRLCLLFPKLPLWAGVVLTAADVLMFLSFSDPSRGQGHPVRMFGYTIIGLVLAVFSCFVVLLVQAEPDWSEVFMGYIPNKNLFQSEPDAVYAAVGILGATVMPHALFLGSYLATQDRISDAFPEEKLPSPAASRPTIKTRIQLSIFPLFRVTRAERAASDKDYRTKYGERENNSLTFIQQHLQHGITDVVTSLIALAVPINSAILILAATVFFNGPDRNHDATTGLFEAHNLIKDRIGSGAATVFALALVCAGQTSSMTATLAGQIVSEGFIEWKVSPFLRRLITRCIGLVPSVVVAIAVGRNGIDVLLVASQVVLSVVLPFVAFPLIYLTSTEIVMRVQRPAPEIIKSSPKEREEENQIHGNLDVLKIDGAVVQTVNKAEKAQVEVVRQETLDFSNGRFLTSSAYIIWSVVLVANAYAIAMLLGTGVV